MDTKARALLLERILEDFGFKGSEKSWQFKEEGHNKIASIHAKDVYDIIKILDWDNLQHGDEVVDAGGTKKRKRSTPEREESEDELEEEEP